MVNESSVEIAKSEERPDLFYCGGDRPVSYSSKLDWVHGNFSFFYYHSQVFDSILLNSHFNAFKKSSFSHNLCSTNLVYRSRSSCVLAKIKMSSIYIMTMHPSIIVDKMASIIAWNVGGELHIPKNMTIGSKSPRLVLKAAFHSSPFLMRTLLYPHLTSNFVKYLAPFSLSMISEINGNG